MEYRKLGKNGPEVSVIGFGAWAIGGKDWGETNDETSKQALHSALDNGVNFIDTADVYGFGHSENLIHEVLEERGEKDKVIVATKAGSDFYGVKDADYKGSAPVTRNFKKDYLIYAAEQSLKRLNVEALDLLQLHSPAPEVLQTDEPWEALEKLKTDGKIKLGGLSVQSFKNSEHAYLLDEFEDLLDVLQIRYNLLERDAEESLLPKAADKGTGIIVRIPLLFGFLTGKFNKESKFGDDDHRRINLSKEKLENYLDELNELENVYSDNSEFTKAQISLKFAVSHPAVSTAIPGAKNSAQVTDNIKAAEIDSIDFSNYLKNYTD